MASVHLIQSNLHIRLFIDTLNFLLMIVEVLQVSALHNNTVLMLVFEILSLMLCDSCFESQIFFNCRDAVLILPIRAFTFSLGLRCSSMMLTKYVNAPKSSIKCYMFAACVSYELLLKLSSFDLWDSIVFWCKSFIKKSSQIVHMDLATLSL